MKKPITRPYKCTNPECGAEFTLIIHPFYPGKFSGPPEHCHPDEGGEIEPSECEFCETKVDESKVIESLANEDVECGWED